MSVLSDNPSVMLTRAELDDWHEFAKPVGAPYFNSHHEVQQAASGALRPGHQMLHPLLDLVINLLTGPARTSYPDRSGRGVTHSYT
jgi:hypothetical protein